MEEANGRSFAPTADMLQDMVDLFDANGISLHVDAGDVYTNIANYDEAFGGETLAYSQYYFNNDKAVKLLKARNGLGERKNIFHLGVIGDQTQPGAWATGEATIGTGSFFVAKNARMNEDEQLRNTILHEFGHNPGLRHNGAAASAEGLPGEAHDPTYRSVMNYRYQIGENAIFDFSHTGYTYNRNGVVREIPADWDNIKLGDNFIGKDFASFGPGQTKPVALEGAKATRKAEAKEETKAEAPAAKAEAPAAKANPVQVNEIKAEAIRAQTPAQAAQVVAAQAAGPNIAAIIGGIIAVLAVLGIGAGAAFMM